MKKRLFLIPIILLIVQMVFAQDTIHLKHAPDTIRLKHTVNELIVTDRPPQGFFAELFGRSLFFSLNYDRRLFKRVDGLGFTVGIGYITEDDGFGDNVSLFSLPISINYLLGSNGKYLELGGGFTYFNANVSNSGDISNGSSSIIGTMTIGYRSQPLHSGFMFRAGINPFFFSNAFIPYYPYVSFGYNF